VLDRFTNGTSKSVKGSLYLGSRLPVKPNFVNLLICNLINDDRLLLIRNLLLHQLDNYDSIGLEPISSGSTPAL